MRLQPPSLVDYLGRSSYECGRVLALHKIRAIWQAHPSESRSPIESSLCFLTTDWLGRFSAVFSAIFRQRCEACRVFERPCSHWRPPSPLDAARARPVPWATALTANWQKMPRYLFLRTPRSFVRRLLAAPACEWLTPASGCARWDFGRHSSDVQRARRKRRAIGDLYKLLSRGERVFAVDLGEHVLRLEQHARRREPTSIRS